MEIFLDCLPCVLRQVLEASRMTTDRHEVHAEIMEESIKIILRYKEYSCSPEMVTLMHQKVKDLTGVSDPYEKVKERDIEAAKRAYPLLKQFLKQKQNALYWALKVAATGNIIDSAIYADINFEDCLEEELTKEFGVCDIGIFEDRLKTAKSLLIIGDNAGETVFDKVLMEQLADLDIVYAVRDEPIINDATIKEAYASGLNHNARIISSGCSSPGTILDKCNVEFLEVFRRADIVISKGQGNFEALAGCGEDIFFLLKAKCVMIAKKLGVGLNDYAFKHYERII